MDVAARLAIEVLSVGVDEANRQLDRLNRTAGRTEQQAERTASATERVARSYQRFAQILAALAIGKLVQEFLQAADAMKRLEGQLRLVTDGTQELARAQADLFNLAQETRSSYEATVTLYTRLARSTESLALGHERLLRISETVNKAIQVSGISSQEAAAGVIQFGQALASGTLRGDELRSVLENMPRLAQALKAGLEEQGLAGAAETAVGALRRLAGEGRLTTETLIRALESQARQIDEEFTKLPRTIGSAMTQLQNDILRLVDGIDGQGGLSDSMLRLIDAFREMANDEGVQQFLRTMIDLFATLVDTVTTLISTLAEMSNTMTRIVEQTAALATGASTATGTVGGYLTGGGVQSVYEPPAQPSGGTLPPGGGGGAAARVDHYAELVQRMQEALFLSDTLEKQLGATSTAEVRKYEIALRMQQAEIDLLHQKRTLSDDERDRLRSLIEAQIDAENRVDALRAAQQRREEALQEARRSSMEKLEYEMRRQQAIGQEVASTFQGLFRSIIDGSFTASDALSRIADMLLRIVELAVFGDQGFGGFLGGVIGNLLSPGVGGSTIDTVTRVAGSMGFGPFDKGGVFSNGPSYFDYQAPGGWNRGVVAEKRPEALLPLTQMADGALGVRAAGGGQGQNHYNITVNVQAQEGETSDQQARRIAQAIRVELDALVDQRMTKQLRPGGILSEAYYSR